MSDNGLTDDERAAMRAFVARCEVRLSTIHRIAVGLLSGAGLLVILPVVARDAVTGVIRALLINDLGAADVALLAGTVALLTAPGSALWLLFADLTRFYFHAEHLSGEAGLLAPRFTLTSLRLPSDELGPAARARLDVSRTSPGTTALVVPSSEAERRRIDRRLVGYGFVGQDHDDTGRLAGLSKLAGSTSRPLIEEVSKIETGMIRHVIRLRVLVLRYVKALLALLTTAVAVYAADAIVAGLGPDQDLGRAEQGALAAVILAWVPAVISTTTTPLRWVEMLFVNDASSTAALEQDPDLTHVERVTIRVAVLAWLAAALSMALTLADTDGAMPRIAGAAVLVGSIIATAALARTGRARTLTRHRVR